MPKSKRLAADKRTSGVAGFDEITGGGLARGRITLVVGPPGCGKTIFALGSLVAGVRAGEPGIFITFEERNDHVRHDMQSFNWGLARIPQQMLAFIDGELSAAVVLGGDFDLLGLLAATGAKARQIRAERIVLDGLDVLLGHLGDPSLIRRELFRLREWVYESGLTCVLTAKAGLPSGGSQPAYEFLQFASDGVVHLDHRLAQGTAIRTLRVTKYRGTGHSANEFPFTITSSGIELASSTSPMIHHSVSTARVTSGVERLDAMLGGGYYRGTSVLVSGAPGTSKTSLAASFADAACQRKERTVYVSFDEAPDQIVRNVASVGIELERHRGAGVLAMCSLRARADNPDAHVARIRRLLHEHRAVNLCIDPISALSVTCDPYIADRAAVQVLDVAKGLGITTVSTSLLANTAPLSEETPIGISTIADTWMHVSYVSQGGERNRALTIIKSRGMEHSNQVRELVLGKHGVTLANTYHSQGEVLMGTLRWEKENEDRRAKALAGAESELRHKQAEAALAETRARVEAARAELAMREAELRAIVDGRRTSEKARRTEDTQRSRLRGALGQNETPGR